MVQPACLQGKRSHSSLYLFFIMQNLLLSTPLLVLLQALHFQALSLFLLLNPLLFLRFYQTTTSFRCLYRLISREFETRFQLVKLKTILTDFSNPKTQIFIIVIQIQNAITFISNVKTILRLPDPKNINAYFLL